MKWRLFRRSSPTSSTFSPYADHVRCTRALASFTVRTLTTFCLVTQSVVITYHRCVTARCTCSRTALLSRHAACILRTRLTIFSGVNLSVSAIIRTSTSKTYQTGSAAVQSALAVAAGTIFIQSACAILIAVWRFFTERRAHATRTTLLTLSTTGILCAI